MAAPRTRPKAQSPEHAAQGDMAGMSHMAPDMSQTPMSMEAGKAPWPPVPVMGLLSFLALAAGATLALLA